MNDNNKNSNEKEVQTDKLGIIDSALQIVREQGWKGLFVGMQSRLILVSLGGMLYFWSAELAEELFEVTLRSKHH